MKKYLVIFSLLIAIIILFFITSQKTITFSELIHEEFYDQEINQIIVDKRDEQTGNKTFLVVDSKGDISRIMEEFSKVVLKEDKINKNKQVTEYAISFTQPSETHSLYANHDRVQFKGASFKIKEKDFIKIINSLYTSEDWLDPNEYLKYYERD